MNKADNDASTRAIDSLINYEVRLWCTFNVWFSPYRSFDALFFLYGLADALFSPILSIFSQTVKYFNNEAFEADQYDEYLKSKLS